MCSRCGVTSLGADQGEFQCGTVLRRLAARFHKKPNPNMKPSRGGETPARTAGSGVPPREASSVTTTREDIVHCTTPLAVEG